MNFTDVLKWVLEAKLEEQLAIHAVLKCNVVDPAHQAHDDAMRPSYGKSYTLDKSGVPVKVDVPGLGMADFIAKAEQGTAPPEAGRPLKPGRYQLTPAALGRGQSMPYPLKPARNGVKLKAPRSKRVSVEKVRKALGAEPLAPAKLYTPSNEFGKRWWRRLQASKHGMTPQELAGIAGKANMHKQVSSTLGNLYSRGIVDRWRKAGSAAFLYTVKETLR